MSTGQPVLKKLDDIPDQHAVALIDPSKAAPIMLEPTDHSKNPNTSMYTMQPLLKDLYGLLPQSGAADVSNIELVPEQSQDMRSLKVSTAKISSISALKDTEDVAHPGSSTEHSSARQLALKQIVATPSPENTVASSFTLQPAPKKIKHMNDPEISRELERRDLPSDGYRKPITARLELAVEVPITHQERKAFNALRVNEHKAAALLKVVVFRFFNRFPTEIQDIIWDFMDPGPRVLRVMNEITKDAGHFGLNITKNGQPPNPVALFVCKQSRARALKRYKLVLGTNFLYANFPGGDILHVGSHILNSRWQLNDSNLPMLPDNIVEDLEAVQHMILPMDAKYLRNVYRHPRIGMRVRDALVKFLSLQRITLIQFKSSILIKEPLLAGYETHHDPFFELPEEILDTEYSWGLHSGPKSGFMSHLVSSGKYICKETFAHFKDRRPNLIGHPCALAFISSFEILFRAQSNLNIKIPKVRMMELDHVPYQPKRLDEGYRSPLGQRIEGQWARYERHDRERKERKRARRLARESRVG